MKKGQKGGGIPQICDSQAKRDRSILFNHRKASAPNGFGEQFPVVDLT